MRIPTPDSTPDSKSAATRFSRREAFRSIAALTAATAAPSSSRQVAAPSDASQRIVFSEAHAVVEIATGRVRGYSEDSIHTGRSPKVPKRERAAAQRRR